MNNILNEFEENRYKKFEIREIQNINPNSGYNKITKSSVYQGVMYDDFEEILSISQHTNIDMT